MNKVNFVENLLFFEGIDVIGINETWLIPAIADSFLAINQYHLERSDSAENVRKHGVAFYVRHGIKYNVVDNTPNNCIILKLIDFDLYVLNVYRPPSSSSNDNSALLEYLSTFCTDKEVILMGDFNLPSINWWDVSSVHGVT